MVIYTNHIPEGFAGITNAFIIRIRPEYKDDKGIHAHELYHVKCWWKWLVIGRLLYFVSQHFRLEEEISAYREQLRINKEDGKKDYIDLYVGFICTKYGLDVRPEYIKIRLGE